MIDGKKVVFYELNEVPRKVLVDYTQANPRSALAQIYRHSAFYETVTADKGHLSPWITWPTLHRGVTNEKHHKPDLAATFFTNHVASSMHRY